MSARLHPSQVTIILIGFMALAALGTAWIAQYGFGLFPCELCLYQRLPYIGVLALSILAATPMVDPGARRLAVYVAAILFATTAGIAFFHVGVEQEWWNSTCAPTGSQAFSFDEVRSALRSPGQPACNDIPFTFLGLSPAGYNVIAGVVLSVLSLWAARRSELWQDS
ncbi:MAG: disulfide bond formation protein B [Rhodospirillaceae bacterium]|jgi:disulfide bond formation protein DsbB|nr:disulfide bond formation protein B [Rhodospirillaceae bacterium]MBT5241089.1 disulfide bond formation protein B [Rhodospirillaceae bacterium]MBT5566745.1 disulfide bond formation protein B [Rhodospirillaceae bacterium]MBT6090807.1 disulfide bond formation protein B [Rhodospirillaceae bacterium]MBT6960729.1 disulfide bond formation protein B [Rhodospirillaceae bacterium]